MAHSQGIVYMIIKTDCIEGLKSLDDESVNCIITSPPYNKKGLQGTQTKKSKKDGNQIWKKFEIDYSDYGDDMSEEDYQIWMVEFLNGCHRVIKKGGSIFFNVELFQLIIWDRRNSPNIRKENLVPCTEHIYWFCKDKPKTFRNNMNKDFIGEVWKITADKQKKHPAPFPEQLVKNCILLTTEKGDLVLDPFMGSGTTAIVSETLGRKWLGYEMSQTYIDIAKSRINESIWG